MRDAIGQHVHMTQREAHMMVGPSITDEQYEWLAAHRELIPEVVAERYDSAGFLITLPPILETLIQETSVLSVDIETTQLTPSSPASVITNSTKIDGRTLAQYRMGHPDCTVNCIPRVRIFTLKLISKECPDAWGDVYAFDLDRLTPDQKRSLYRAVIPGKVIIGHNLAFEFNWFAHDCPGLEPPSLILDTLLLATLVRPNIGNMAFFDAASGDLTRMAEASSIIESEHGRKRENLNYLAQCIGLPPLNKQYQSEKNWCLSTLEKAHWEYVQDDVVVPVRLLKQIFGILNMDHIRRTLAAEYPWYEQFVEATLLSARTQGVPYDVEAALALQAELARTIKEQAELLAKPQVDKDGNPRLDASGEPVMWPEFTPEIVASVAKPGAGLNAKAREAFIAHIRNAGLQPPRKWEKQEDGSYAEGAVTLGKDAIALEGYAGKIPCWSIYNTIAAAKADHRAIGQWVKHCKSGRVKGLVGFTAVSGRARSSSPNQQNTPRNPGVRALVRAEPGHTLLWADYSAIELRNAAGLAERAYEHIMDQIDADVYFFRLCDSAKRCGVGQPHPDDMLRPDGIDESDWNKGKAAREIGYFFPRVLEKGRTLAKLFNAGLDPHLVTALTMLQRNPEFPIQTDPVEHLVSLDDREREALAKKYSTARTEAKAGNFGLLYGMGASALHSYGITSYGLVWTPEDANAMHRAWFDLYPEIKMWQLWTKYVCGSRIDRMQVKTWNWDKEEVEHPKFDPRVYSTTTLGGRPFHVLDKFTDAGNYQSQGTGADILTRAMVRLPAYLQECFVLSIHDELLFHVPDAELDRAELDLERTMVEAGDHHLQHVVPCKVDLKSGQHWTK
jgi:hypothetical protein